MTLSFPLARLAVTSGLTIGLVACANGTVPPPGNDSARFDPQGSLSTVSTFAGPGAVLTSYMLRFVKPDGTMDLDTETYMAHAGYDFVAPAESDPAKPVGAGGFAGPGVRDVTVAIWRPGQFRRVQTGSSRHDYRHRGMERRPGEPRPGTVPVVASPTCKPRDLWATAVTKGAPPNAVAMLSWTGSTGEYSFSIDNTPTRLRFDASCKVLP